MHWRDTTSRSRRITNAIWRYDRNLYAKEYEGRIDIFRKTFCYKSYDVDGVLLHVATEEPHRFLCLTDTWNAWGKPVEWGLCPILAKIQSCDLWKRDISSEIISHKEKIEEAKDRHRKNETEAFLLDNRRAIAKHWGDINTSSLDKRTDRRYRDELKKKG